MKTRQTIKAEELVAGDLTIDKTGASWHVTGVMPNETDGTVRFGIIGMPYEKNAGKTYRVTKFRTDTVTVVRYAPSVQAVKDNADQTRPAAEHDAAVNALTYTLGAEKVTEVTAAQLEEMGAATEDDPVQLPAFDEMTDLEQRTHVFLFHGVVSYDILARADLAKMHQKITADPPNGRLVPHSHGAVAIGRPAK